MSYLLQVGYNILFVTAFALGSPYFLWRLWRRGRLTTGFGQRLGLYSPEIRDRIHNADIWIHAVSVGEAMIARVILKHLREKRPDLKVVISTTTPTGQGVARAAEDSRTAVIYNPFDFLWSVRQAFEQIRPKRLILVEAEIWPNYLWCAKRRGIPVYLVNARLSDRTAARYRRFRWFCRPVLRLMDLVLAQDQTDADRLAEAGFPPERIFPVGSLKYDVADIAASRDSGIESWWSTCGWAPDDPVLMGGSTHPGEEALLVNLYQQIKSEVPQLRLVLAPRHAERGAAVHALCVNRGLKAVLRTELARRLSNGSRPDALILDSTGELSALYAKASVVFIGKSFRGKGGQNFIEAACTGTPIVVGPHMQNFRNLTREFVAGRGLIQVATEFELGQELRQLLKDVERRRELGQRGREIFQKNLGAGRATADILARSLENPS
jgi:3-deoxy-D-manno-octulosonic-acid transferase